MTNKRVFEYEPMPMLCEASGDGVTSKVFALGTIVCVASGGNSGTLSLRCESGASTAKLIKRLGAGSMRDVARMLLTAADEMDAMQAMEQKKKDKK